MALPCGRAWRNTVTVRQEICLGLTHHLPCRWLAGAYPRPFLWKGSRHFDNPHKKPRRDVGEDNWWPEGVSGQGCGAAGLLHTHGKPLQGSVGPSFFSFCFSVAKKKTEKKKRRANRTLEGLWGQWPLNPVGHHTYICVCIYICIAATKYFLPSVAGLSAWVLAGFPAGVHPAELNPAFNPQNTTSGK